MKSAQSKSVRDRSGEQSRDIADAVPVFLWEADASGPVFANPHSLGFLGTDFEALRGSGWTGFLHPDDIPVVLKTCGKALAGSERLSCECRLRRADGEYRWVLASMQSSARRRISGGAIDITERVEAETTLRVSEETFRHFRENSPTVSWIKDEDGCYVYLSQSYERRFGVTFSDWQGKTDEQFWPPEDAAKFRANDLAVLAADNAIQVIEDAQTPDGSVSTWLNTKFPMRDAQGRRYIAGIGLDVTKRVRAEAALRESEERFRLFMDNSPTIAWIKDEDGCYAYLSRSYERRFGVRLADWLGKTDPEFWQPEAAARYRESDLAVLASGQPIQVLEELQNSDGLTEVWLNTKFPFSDAQGRRYVGGIGLDTTERTRFRQALSRTNEQLEARTAELEREMVLREEMQAALAQSQRLEALGQLSGTVAHDFNNLLAAVSLNLEAAEESLRDGMAKDAIHRSIEAIEAGASLTRRLLTFARRGTLAPRHVGLNARVRDMAQFLDETLGRTIRIETSLEDAPWPALADPGEIDSAIVNVALNARDAMPDGGTLSIATSNEIVDAAKAGKAEVEPGDYVCLSISDNGQGMPPEVLRRSVEPFFTTKPEGKGSGLGLSSVYGFARQSGGFAEIDSQVGKGTTVRIFLPRANDGETTRPLEQEVNSVPKGSAQLVLVVDDNDAVRKATCFLIESLGYRIVEASTAPQAIDILLDRDDIDLVLSDVVMPGGMSGHDLAEWIAARRPGINVILVSGNNQAASGAGESAGPPMLVKPYSREALARLMHGQIRA